MRSYWFDQMGQCCVKEQCLGTRVFKDVTHFLAGEPHIDGHEERPHLGHRKVRLQHLERIPTDYCDPIAHPDPAPGQGARKAVDPRAELRVCEAPVAVHDANFVGEDVQRAFEEAERGEQ